jgi:hypothetical protein
VDGQVFGPCICKLSRALDRTPNVRRLVLAGNKYVPTTYANTWFLLFPPVGNVHT